MAFAAWSTWLTWDVRLLRDQVAEQVGWQIAITQAANESPDARSHAVGPLLAGMRSRFADAPAAQSAITELEQALKDGDNDRYDAAAQRLIPHIRMSNGAISGQLGARWDQVALLVFLSLGFAVSALVLTALRDRDQLILVSTTHDLQATKDRLSRVGVGLIGLDDKDNVVFSNEVANGLAARAADVGAWWTSIMTLVHRPGAVPCAVCGEPVGVGRVDVEDQSGAGVRVVEVVFGGHAHDIVESHHHVVLVRDVTEQRRSHVLTVLDERLTSVEHLATALADDLDEPLGQLLDALAAARTPSEHEGAIERAQRAAEYLQVAVSGMRVLAGHQTPGVTDAGLACQRAAQLVRHRVPQQTQLVTQIATDLPVSAQGGKLTQVVFSVLSEAIEACRNDGGQHSVKLDAFSNGHQVVISVTDDRDPRSIPTVMVANRSVTRERVEALGGHLTSDMSQGRRATRLTLPQTR